jgi:hypothetical protein
LAIELPPMPVILMDVAYHYIVHRTIAAFCCGIKQKINFKSLFGIGFNYIDRSYYWLLMYVNQLDLIGKTILHQIYRLLINSDYRAYLYFEKKFTEASTTVLRRL